MMMITFFSFSFFFFLKHFVFVRNLDSGRGLISTSCAYGLYNLSGGPFLLSIDKQPFSTTTTTTMERVYVCMYVTHHFSFLWAYLATNFFFSSFQRRKNWPPLFGIRGSKIYIVIYIASVLCVCVCCLVWKSEPQNQINIF